MGDKCRRFVVDPNIECFTACRCDAIVSREKIFRLYRCHCGVVMLRHLLDIGNISPGLNFKSVTCTFDENAQIPQIMTPIIHNLYFRMIMNYD